MALDVGKEVFARNILTIILGAIGKIKGFEKEISLHFLLNF